MKIKLVFIAIKGSHYNLSVYIYRFIRLYIYIYIYIDVILCLDHVVEKPTVIPGQASSWNKAHSW